jgi:hypothetical protein
MDGIEYLHETQDFSDYQREQESLGGYLHLHNYLQSHLVAGILNLQHYNMNPRAFKYRYFQLK